MESPHLPFRPYSNVKFREDKDYPVHIIARDNRGFMPSWNVKEDAYLSAGRAGNILKGFDAMVDSAGTVPPPRRVDVGSRVFSGSSMTYGAIVDSADRFISSQKMASQYARVPGLFPGSSLVPNMQTPTQPVPAGAASLGVGVVSRHAGMQGGGLSLGRYPSA